MLRAWGRGEDGQIGVGDTCDQFVPAIVEVSMPFLGSSLAREVC
jgi:hypothetical protein